MTVDMNAPDQYLICKHGGYYLPNAQGYTNNVADAGRYTLAEAIRHTHPNGPNGPRDGMTYISSPPSAYLAAVVTNAPERIWAWPDETGHTTDCGEWDRFDSDNPSAVAFIRLDLHEAAVRKARELEQVADNLRKVAAGYEATIRKLMDDKLALERRIREALE